jgi:hypothetical protein
LSDVEAENMWSCTSTLMHYGVVHKDIFSILPDWNSFVLRSVVTCVLPYLGNGFPLPFSGEEEEERKV